MSELANHVAGVASASRNPDPAGTQKAATTIVLRVAEARVEDIGHAIARLAPADLRRIGARTGDVLKITGGTIAVGRVELSDDGHEGMIQIDGTCRSNCGAGLQEQVTVSVIERQDAVAVRFSPLWVGAAPATIAPDRMLEDLMAFLAGDTDEVERRLDDFLPAIRRRPLGNFLDLLSHRDPFC